VAQEICDEFIREIFQNLVDLRTQVQLTYWSEQHFITQELLDNLPFGEILSHTRFYSYVNYSLNALIGPANNTLLYWRLSNVTQFDGTPVLELSLFYDETLLWHYSTPSYQEEIWLQIRLGRRVRFLSRFHLSQTKIEVEFNEIQLQTTKDDDFRFVYTNSNNYQYKFINLEWSTTINAHNPITNPSVYALPITQPNTQGWEAKYQAHLDQIRSLPNNIQIQDTYWDSINPSSQNSTPEPDSDTDYWAPTNFQFASPTPASTNSSGFHACACGTDICYCNNWHPGTPPTPAGIHLWKPRILSQPINSVHYNWQVQTGTLTPVHSVPRTPQVTFHPGFTGFRTF